MNHLDPREVLAYLNELGYCNINAEELKEFMKDLKKLIKNDQRLARDKDKENVDYSAIFSTLHANSTVSSRAKTVKSKPQQQSVITLHITRPRVPKPGLINEGSSERGNFTSDSITPTVSALETGTDTATNLIPGESVTSSATAPKSCLKETRRPKTANSRTKDDELKPKVSFIRPRIPLKPSKSDPVALYQYYQNEWKKQKLPGEDNRANLRWAIRERMLGAGDHARGVSAASSMNTLPRKKK